MICKRIQLSGVSQKGLTGFAKDLFCPKISFSHLETRQNPAWESKKATESPEKPDYES